MKMIAMVFSGLLIATVAGPSLAATLPIAGGRNFEAITGAAYPLVGATAVDYPEDAFAIAVGEAETASAAASSTAATAPGLISIVPEPHPYQLLLGGVGAVFFMARRQWKR